MAPLERGSTSTTQSQVTTRGMKRRHFDDSDHRLSKRFDLLSLDNRGKLYIPVGATSSSQTSPSCSSTSKSPANILMEVEDTKDRVFIHDLEAELADIESDEEHPIFIADIEKHLLKLPKAVLMNDADKLRMENMQLVPYRIPKSISVPEEKDSVRKAIIEARQRMQAEKISSLCDSQNSSPIGSQDLVWNEEDDSDAMDVL